MQTAVNFSEFFSLHVEPVCFPRGCLMVGSLGCFAVQTGPLETPADRSGPLNRFQTREIESVVRWRASELSGEAVRYFIRSSEMHAKSFIRIDPRSLIELIMESFRSVGRFVMR